MTAVEPEYTEHSLYNKQDNMLRDKMFTLKLRWRDIFGMRLLVFRFQGLFWYRVKNS